MEKNNRVGYSMPYSYNLSLAMKLTTILLILSIFTVQANSYAQKTKVTLDLEKVEMQKVLEEIESLTDFKFLYDNTKIDTGKLVSISVNNKPVSEILNVLFKGTSIYYLVRHKQIVLKIQKASQPTSIIKESEVLVEEKYVQNIVSGAITDDKGQPLPGANVVEKGTTNGVTADFDGNFSIALSNESPILVISYIGFSTQEVSVDGKTNIMIILQEDAAGLEEVVVVGYGTQKRVTLTGAVGVVGSKDLKDRPVPTVVEALQGQISGLNVVRTSGQPGNQSINFSIRGKSTFSDNPVLTIIDGVPSSLDMINPNDIESISVLKDAASTAIYGSRATGGVILVTTKTGKAGPPRITWSSMTGVQQPTRFPEKVSALDHALISNVARANDNSAPAYTDEEIAKFSSPDWVDHDWDEYMLSTAMQQNQNFSVSGGNEYQNYYFSAGYLNQDGVVLNTGYEKLNIQINQDIRITEKLEFSFKGGYTPSTTTTPAAELLSNLLRFVYATNQTEAFLSDDGKWLRNSTNTGGGNPLALASKDGGQKKLKSARFTGSFSLSYDIYEDLKLTGSYGLVSTKSREQSYQNILTLYSQENTEQISQVSDDNYLDVRYNKEQLSNISILANYTKEFGNHNLSILGGMTNEWYEANNDHLGTRGFLTDDIYVISAGTSDPNFWSIAGGASDWSLSSYVSRINYNYKNKYLFEAAARYDGSSRFIKEKQWGLFPSASVGWIISDESFLKDNKTISFFKLRGSWGQVGNQNVGFYPFANTLTPTTYYFGGNPHSGVTPSGAPNPSLTWETKEALNFGIDGRAFNNLLEFNFDIFNEKTHDILLQLPLPTTFGQIEPVQNAGRVDNKGWELQLKHRNQIGDFNYGLSVQVSDATETVIDMGGISPRIQGSTITEEGYPINMWYGWESAGFFDSDEAVANASFQDPQTSAGDIQYVEHGGDPNSINSEDRVRLGRSDPRFPYGVRLNASYKNIDFSAFGQGLLSHNVWTRNTELSTLRSYHTDYWTPENKGAAFPQPRQGGGPGVGINKDFSSFWLENAAYFRMKNIEIGYSLNSDITKKLKISNARIFLSGENLITITNYLGYDPEIATGVAARLVEGRYPISKVYNFGLSINF